MRPLSSILPQFFQSAKSRLTAGTETGCSPLLLNLQWIGRSGSGKTTLETSLRLCTLGHALPSGLLFSGPADNPAEGIAKLNRMRARITDLRTSGMTTTLQSEPDLWLLYEGEHARVQVTMNECVGQALTNPDGSDEFARHFAKHQKRLGSSDAIWITMPMPMEQGPALDDVAYDIQVANVHLQSALSTHAACQHPCTVVILLTQIDAAFQTPEDAREKLDDAEVIPLLAPLINTVTNSSVVHSAAIMPVSAFGFQNAVPRGSTTVSTADVDHSDKAARASYMNASSLLKHDQQLQPFNLQGLLPWTVLQTMMTRQVTLRNGQGAIMKTIATRLKSDVDALAPWINVIR